MTVGWQFFWEEVKLMIQEREVIDHPLKGEDFEVLLGCRCIEAGLMTEEDYLGLCSKFGAFNVNEALDRRELPGMLVVDGREFEIDKAVSEAISQAQQAGQPRQ